ncbi:hypothetical protein GCM10023185_35890 [Hymenobacter saemangeumensis]|uniref:Uncharacterized protein n=1 Tax=Hymenobacter saemangeumensis TaxID=1084522 RepID=A0ABP8IQE7_9BACT
MKLFYATLAGGALLLATTSAMLPPPGPPAPLQPVQSIALGTHAALAGTIQLTDRNTVLLLTDTETPNIHLQCLDPKGKTVWEANVERYQRDRYADNFKAIGELFLPPKSKESQAQLEQLHLAKLVAMQVLSEGNTIYTVERLEERALKKLPKGSPLKAGQVHVHRIDGQGKVSKVIFDGRPQLESRKSEQYCLGRYVDGGGYVEIMRVTNKREETEEYFLDHYDQASGKVRREPFTLPVHPKQPGGMNFFKEWFQDWAYLGHRPNQTYFVRRVLTTAPEQKPGQQPLVYQVLTTDDKGATTGNFSTILGLDKGTAPRSSGDISNLGELDHIPFYYTHSAGRSSITYDGWDNNTGHTGSFWLDYATGDVIIYGEYDEEELPTASRLYDLKGYFQRRYAADGSPKEQVQLKYGEAMRAKKKNNLFAGGFNMYYRRQTRFHLDPLSKQAQYSFWLNSVYGSDEMIDMFITPDMKYKRYDYANKINGPEHLYTVVMFPQHFWLYKNSFDAHDYRVYERAGADEPPVYAALEKLRRSSGSQMPFHEFHLMPTGDGNGLVVERKTPVGGSLQVYTF